MIIEKHENKFYQNASHSAHYDPQEIYEDPLQGPDTLCWEPATPGDHQFSYLHKEFQNKPILVVIFYPLIIFQWNDFKVLAIKENNGVVSATWHPAVSLQSKRF